jgi:hypothetical protein
MKNIRIRSSAQVRKNRKLITDSDSQFSNSLFGKSFSEYFDLYEAYPKRVSTPVEIHPDTQKIIDILKKDESDISDDEKKQINDFDKKYRGGKEDGTMSALVALDYMPKFNKISQGYENEQYSRAVSPGSGVQIVASKQAAEKSLSRQLVSAQKYIQSIREKISPYTADGDIDTKFGKMMLSLLTDENKPNAEDLQQILKTFHEEISKIVSKDNPASEEIKKADISKAINTAEQSAKIKKGFSQTSQLISPKEKKGFLNKLKSMFSEHHHLSDDFIAEQIIRLMIQRGRVRSLAEAHDIQALVLEMIEDHAHDQMGPSETGVFDAPHEEHPGYMLLGNLKKLASKSSDLAKLASPWDDAEPWIESKINSAAEHIDAVHDYIMYSVLKKDFDASEHEDMMYECGEMPGDLMMEPVEAHGHMGSDMIGGRHFGDGGSAQMAKGQLFQIAKKSQSLSDRLVDDDTLPEWMQSKVAMAYQSISAIYDYLDYKMMR